MYDDVGASGVGRGLLGGGLAGGTFGAGEILPNTGFAVLQIIALALIVMGFGVALLRFAKNRGVSATDE